MGYDSEPGREEIKYFRKVCEPKLEMQHLQVDNGELSFKLVLRANEFVFLELEKMI